MKINKSIKAIVRKDKAKANGKMPICLQVIINGEVYRRAIGEYVNDTYWDNANGKVKKGYPNFNDINDIIDFEVGNLKKYLTKVELSSQEVSIRIVKEYYNSNTTASINNNDLFKFWECQVANWKSIKVYNTIKNYNVTYNRLKEFAKGKGIMISEVSLDFIERFDLFLKNKKGNTLAGANTRHKCLKTILRAAIAKEIIQKNPYINFPLRKVEGRKVFLSIEELKQLETFNFCNSKANLALVRDMYVFSCYTGLRISDVTNLKWENIDGELIKINVIKTKKEFKTGLINKSIIIINRYKSITKDYVFPKLSHQKINKNLKKIASLLSFNKDLTFHTSRHTFASLLNQKNTNLIHIKDLLGHENINVTMNYIHSIEGQKLQQLFSLDNI